MTASIVGAFLKRDRDRAAELIGTLSGRPLDAPAAWVSIDGRHLDLGRTQEAPASIYAPIGTGFRQVFIMKSEAERLFPSSFSVSALGTMLLEMGEGGHLYIEGGMSSACPVGASFLRETLQGAICEDIGDNWLRMGWYPELATDLARLTSAYPLLRGKGKYEIFRELWLSGGEPTHPEKEKREHAALYHYMYSLRGANYKSFIIDRVLKENFGPTPLAGFDMAGGFGFMAAELAALGHSLAAIDFNERSITVGGQFLDAVGLNPAVIRHGDARQLTGAGEGLDFMVCIEALCAIGKQFVPQLMSDTMARLKKGGLFIINEGALKAGREPGTFYYDRLLGLEELLDYLSGCRGEVNFYNHQTGERIGRGELSQKGPLVAVVRKTHD